MAISVVLAVVLVAVLAVGLAVALHLLARARRELDVARRMLQQLEADLDAALRPAAAPSPAERALRAVVGTASKVRRQGVVGMVGSSLEDLQTWALEKRPDVLQMASSDGTVTLMFSDIEGSTSLNHRLGDRAWVKVLEAHDQVVRARVARHHGQVVKSAGDGFMVAFRDPYSAVRAARGIQRTLARTLDPRLRLAAVKVRIGVHSGRVITRDGDYFGRNVAIAARVADLADGGEVLVTDAVRLEVEGTDERRMRFEEAGEVELRGLPGEHTLWRLVVET